MLYNLGDFDSKNRMKKKAVPRIFVPSASVCASLPSLTLHTQLAPMFWVSKRKRKEADYIFMHQCCYFSLLYNTCPLTLLDKGKTPAWPDSPLSLYPMVNSPLLTFPYNCNSRIYCSAKYLGFYFNPLRPPFTEDIKEKEIPIY